VSQLGLLREQINDDAARNAKRDLLMDRQLDEAERRAEAEFRRQAEDVEVRWVQRAEMTKGFVTMVIVTDKSRRPISRIACRVMSNVDGATIKVPDASGVMPQAQSGSSRLYSAQDILMLTVVKRLLNSGISLMSDGRSVYECVSPDEVVDLLRHGQGVFGIARTGLWQEVHRELTELPSVDVLSGLIRPISPHDLPGSDDDFPS
jgi:hypothetical protein